MNSPRTYLLKKRIIIWFPFVGVFTLILVLSSLSAETVNRFFAFLAFWSDKNIDEVLTGNLLKNFDKVLHFTEYSLLGWFLARALAWEEITLNLKFRWYYLFFPVMAGLAVFDEFTQTFSPGRDVSFFDFVADMTGASLIALFFYLNEKQRIIQIRTRRDPAFQRKTWQRFIYFVPVFFAVSLILLFEYYFIKNINVYYLVSVLYFFAALFLARFLFWETWWSGSHKKKRVVLLLGYVGSLLFCLINALAQQNRPHYQMWFLFWQIIFVSGGFGLYTVFLFFLQKNKWIKEQIT